MLKLLEDYKSSDNPWRQMDLNDIAYLQMILGPDINFDKNHLDADKCREIARNFSK